MFERITRRSWVVVLAASLLVPLSLGGLALRGQEEAAPVETQKQEPKKPRGRLPTYYSKVVSTSQREEIYSIQATYQEQIDQLLLQLKQLEQKRDEEVEAVLTEDQRKQVAEMVEEARKRRTALRRAGEPEEPAAEPAAAP